MLRHERAKPPVTSICSLRAPRWHAPGFRRLLVGGVADGAYRSPGGREQGKVPGTRTGGRLASPVAGIGVAVPGNAHDARAGDVGPGRGGGAGAGATAWGWGNGLGAVITTSRWPAGLLREALIPGASRAREVGHVCVCAGHRLATLSASLRSFVRIYSSEQCPRQDSNLRSRLRRPILFTAATWQNALFPSGWGAYGGRAGYELLDQDAATSPSVNA